MPLTAVSPAKAIVYELYATLRFPQVSLFRPPGIAEFDCLAAFNLPPPIAAFTSPNIQF